MAEYKYETTKKITIKNEINKDKYVATDAGTSFYKEQHKYSEIKDIPNVKFDYIFTNTGDFLKDADEIVVNVYKKFKNTDRAIPAFRNASTKVLKAGDSMTFTTALKDEVVFYEKVKDLYKGEVSVTIEDAE